MSLTIWIHEVLSISIYKELRRGRRTDDSRVGGVNNADLKGIKELKRERNGYSDGVVILRVGYMCF